MKCKTQIDFGLFKSTPFNCPLPKFHWEIHSNSRDIELCWSNYWPESNMADFRFASVQRFGLYSVWRHTCHATARTGTAECSSQYLSRCHALQKKHRKGKCSLEVSPHKQAYRQFQLVSTLTSQNQPISLTAKKKISGKHRRKTVGRWIVRNILCDILGTRANLIVKLWQWTIEGELYFQISQSQFGLCISPLILRRPQHGGFLSWFL